MAKTSPPVILGGLARVPVLPWKNDEAWIDESNPDRTICSFLIQALYTADIDGGAGNNDPAALVRRHVLSKKFVDADASSAAEIELTTEEVDLLERCICSAMNNLACVTLMGHLRDHQGPKIEADKEDAK